MIVRSEVSLYRCRLATPLSLVSYAHFAIGGKNVARRCKKPRATKFIGMGNAYILQRATKFKTTGNKIYRNGQRNLPERALKFKASGDEIYTNPFIYRRWAGISVLLFIHAYLYIRIGINNKTNI